MSPSLAVVAISVVLGLVICIVLAGRRRTLLGLFVLAVGIGLAWPAWWFVPNLDGLSRWSAMQDCARLAHGLEAGAAGDSTAFESGARERNEITAAYPEFKSELDAAEKAWIDRSRAFWETEVDQLPAGETNGFSQLRAQYDAFLDSRLRVAEFAWFERTYQQLAPGDFKSALRIHELKRTGPDWEAKVHPWETSWVDRTLEAMIKEIRPLVESKPATASKGLQQLAGDMTALGDFTEQQRRVLELRRQAAIALLQAVKKESRALIATDRYQAVSERADKLFQEFSREAEAVGLGKDMVNYQESCKFLAKLARQARKPDPKP
jgi:hypothetical protein